MTELLNHKRELHYHHLKCIKYIHIIFGTLDRHLHLTTEAMNCFVEHENHYINVIMTTMASQITSLTVVYLTVYSDADQRKHQSSASLAFVWGIHWDRWIPRTKGHLRGKCFHLMTSSCVSLWKTMIRLMTRRHKEPWHQLPWRRPSYRWYSGLSTI